MKRLFLLLACLFTLAACGDDDIVVSKRFWIDNPTADPIMVAIDGRSFVIEGGGGEPVELKAGKHEMSFNGNQVHFVVKPVKNFDTIINPTFSNYVLYHEVYQLEGTEESEREYNRIMKNYMNTYLLEGDEFLELPLKVFNSLFIEQGIQQWQYGLSEIYPDMVEFDNNLRYSVLSKLFRENDFYDYYGGEELPVGFRFKPGPDSYDALESFELIPEGMDCGCEEAEPLFNEWRGKFMRIPELGKGRKVSEASKEVFQVIPYTLFTKDVEKACSNSHNRDLPPNNYDAMLREARKNSMNMLFRNVYIVK